MPCVRGSRCGKPNPQLADRTAPEAVGYNGAEYWICADHAGDFDQVYANVKNDSPDTRHDARQLLVVMSCKDIFRQCMHKLVDETNARTSSLLARTFSIHQPHFHLSKALTYYEYKCWFGDQQKIFAGLLSSQEFLAAMNNGYMVKDPGPGPMHGEFSHRLQWHVLMRVMTQDFATPMHAAWRLSPLELYSWTGTSGYWGAALEGTVIVAGQPGSPSWVDDELRTDPELSRTSLGIALSKRREKRLEMYELIASQAQNYAQGRGFLRNVVICHDGSYRKTSGLFRAVNPTAVGNFIKTNPKFVVINMTQVFELLYAWKKTGGPKGIWDPQDNNHNRNVASMVWREESKARGKGDPRFHYEDLGNGNYSTGSLLEHHAQCQDGPITQRKQSSRAQLR